MAATVTVTSGGTAVANGAAPVAVADSYTTNEDTPLNVAASGVLTNDTDTESDPLTAVLVTGVAHGSIVLNANGSFSYTPAANYNGPDSFSYQAFDGTTASTEVTVSLTVTSVNDVPVAVNDVYWTHQNTQLNVTGRGVLTNDTDGDGNADIDEAYIWSLPTHGTLPIPLWDVHGGFRYTPSPGYVGVDSFQYYVGDGQSFSPPGGGTVTINVGNRAPIGNTDSYIIAEDTLLTVAARGVLANDTDPDGDTLLSYVLTGASHGGVSMQPDGSFVYQGNLNYNGPDSFTYKVGDGFNGLTTVTVTLDVTAVNDVPVAYQNQYNHDEDEPVVASAQYGVIADDYDPDGTLTAELISGPTQGGTFTFNSDGSFTYIPVLDFDGTDIFTYRAFDGVQYSATVPVYLNFGPVPDTPVAAADAYSTSEDTTLNVAAAGVLTDDADADGDALTAVLVTGPGHGTLVLNADGSLSYVPAANFNGTDSFTYHAEAAAEASNTVTVTITVTAVNDAPIAPPIAAKPATGGAPLTVAAPGPLAGATDADGDALTAVLVTGPAHGTLTLGADGSYTYTPDADFSGTDSFTYAASDRTALSNPVTITFLVSAAALPPVTPVAGELPATGSDPAGPLGLAALIAGAGLAALVASRRSRTTTN